MRPGRRTRLLPAIILALAMIAATSALAQGQQATVGGACSTNGATTSANLSGQILICTSGAWALDSNMHFISTQTASSSASLQFTNLPTSYNTLFLNCAGLL